MAKSLVDTVARGWRKVRSGGGRRGLVFIENHSWRTGVEVEGSILLIWNSQETGTLLLMWGDNWRCSGCVSWDAAAVQLTALATVEMETCSDLTVVTSLWIWEAWVSDRLRPGPSCVSGCVCYVFVASDLRTTLFLNKLNNIFTSVLILFIIRFFNWPKKPCSSGETGTLTGVCL